MESIAGRFRFGSRIVFLWALIILPFNSARPDSFGSRAESIVLAKVDVRGGLDQVRLPIFASWLGPDESVTALVIAPLSRIKSSGENYLILDSPANPKDYILAARSRPKSRREGRAGGRLSSLRILLDDGRRVVARASEDEAETLAVSGFEVARLPETPIVFRAAPETSAAAPLSIVPDPIVQEMMNEATSTKTRTYDGNLSGEWPVTITGAGYTIATRHTRSGTPISQAAQYVYEFMRDLGLQVAFQNWSRGTLSGRNVSGTLAGATLPNEIVLLTAHLDDMPSSGPAPGADDNASGCAAVLTAAEILSHYSFQRTVRFVFFTGEEQGLYGSEAYAGASAAAGENIVAVLNLDMIAWDNAGGPVVNLYLRQAANPGYASDLQIAETFAGVVAAYGLSANISPKFIADGSGESDHASFWNKGYPAILLIEDDWYDFNSAYHTANDRLALLNTDFFADVTKAAVGTVAHLSSLAGSTRITLSKTSLAFGAIAGGPATPGQSVVVGGSDVGAFAWNASSDRSWLVKAPASGSGTGSVTVSVDASGLSAGTYTGTVGIFESGVSGSPAKISVTLTVIGGGGQSPFGSFDTPIEGSTVRGSLAVTGWALDDIEVTGVKIHRNPVGSESTPLGGLIYIGDAVFVEGARPDIETAYPSHPLKYRGGWGYMLLTNFLPNGGNGTFTLYAIATDREGHQIEIGRKSMTCDNRNAVNPFGAIDTPAQGGTTSEAAFVNFGWALTPLPKSIPIDGSTITVWVDGLPLGHPTYNNYRPDIAALFPGYANSNGAVGYSFLNTTGYPNGVHTIAWSVADSDGAVDGIGSRYFRILNTGSGSKAGGPEASNPPKAGILGGTSNLQPESEVGSIEKIQTTISDMTSPLHIRRGYDFDRPAEPVYPNREGGICVSIPELERVAIYLDPSQAWETREELEARGRSLLKRNISSLLPRAELFTAAEAPGLPALIASRMRTAKPGGTSAVLARGFKPRASGEPKARPLTPRFKAYLLIGTELRPLPIGSSFDSRDGVLFWQPGPGFLGNFDFIFFDGEQNLKRAVKIRIGI